MQTPAALKLVRRDPAPATLPEYLVRNTLDLYLVTAAASNDTNQIRTLLKQGANPARLFGPQDSVDAIRFTEPTSALKLAGSRLAGHAARMLVDAGAPIVGRDFNFASEVLGAACFAKDRELVTACTRLGGRVKDDVLMQAFEQPDTALLDLTLTAHGRIDGHTKIEHQSPLALATRAQHFGHVRLLVERYGFPVTPFSPDETPPIRWAADGRTLRYFLSKGATLSQPHAEQLIRDFLKSGDHQGLALAIRNAPSTPSQPIHAALRTPEDIQEDSLGFAIRALARRGSRLVLSEILTAAAARGELRVLRVAIANRDAVVVGGWNSAIEALQRYIDASGSNPAIREVQSLMHRVVEEDS